MSTLLLNLGIISSSALCIEFFKGNKKNRNIEKLMCFIFIIFALISLIVVSGFRHNSGTDFWTYQDIYYLIGRDGIDGSKDIEIGFRLGTLLLTKVTKNPQVMFFLVAIFTNIFIVKSLLRYSTNFSLSLYLYVAMFTYYATFNGIRQYLAASILFLGYNHIKNRNFKKYLIYILIATLIHQSALIMIIAYFLVNQSIRSYSNLIIMIIFGLSIVFYQPFVVVFTKLLGNSRYEHYSDLIMLLGNGTNILRVIIWAIPVLVMYIFRKHAISRYGKEAKIIFNLCFIGTLFMALASRHWIFARVCMYFELYYLLMIPQICFMFDKKTNRLVTFIICVVYLLYSNILLISGDSRILPYQMNFNLF